MTIIYVLIPLSILMMIIAVGAFFWAVRSGQFDDLDTPALDILDDDVPAAARQRRSTEAPAGHQEKNTDKQDSANS